MPKQSFYKTLIDKFPHQTTKKQDIALQMIADFVESKTNDVFLLKGFAGTGKTTLISSLVNSLWEIKQKAVLLAPTGRAAKVMSNYTKKEASTIHKKIYYPKKEKSGALSFVMQINKYRNTVFIIDEASMISDRTTESKLFDNGSLLDDLTQFVSSGYNCKLIFVGDTAQLPPVKQDRSPALSSEDIYMNYHIDSKEIELDEVMRQAEDSGILHNATHLRNKIKHIDEVDFKFDTNNFKDIVRLTDGFEIQSAIQESYDDFSKEDTCIIVRSNKRANQYNLQIRSKILGFESELNVGDYLMVVKNNYFWLKETDEAGFIANGDLIEILELFDIKELYGFKFAEVKIRMVDYEKQKPFRTVLLLDTLTLDSPSLSYEDGNRLYQEIQKDFAHEKSKYKKFMKIKTNKFFNALQVKFGYAVTCHKSQGGQWNTVLLEKPYLPNGIDNDYLRWLYTAITRAKDKLYLINFRDDDFSD